MIPAPRSIASYLSHPRLKLLSTRPVAYIVLRPCLDRRAEQMRTGRCAPWGGLHRNHRGYGERWQPLSTKPCSCASQGGRRQYVDRRSHRSISALAVASAGDRRDSRREGSLFPVDSRPDRHVERARHADDPDAGRLCGVQTIADPRTDACWPQSRCRARRQAWAFQDASAIPRRSPASKSCSLVSADGRRHREA